MKRPLLILLFVLFGFVGWSQEVPIAAQVMCADQPSLEKKLNRWLSSSRLVPDTFVLSQESENLATRLLKKGYVAASVDSVIISKEKIKFYVMAGPTFELGQIHYFGVPQGLIDKAIGKRSKRNELLTPTRLANRKERIIRFFENHGYPFTTVVLDSISLIDGVLNGSMRIDRGPEILIDSILVEGKAKIKAKYLQTYLGIRHKDRYNESRIAAMSTKLKELPFVIEKKDPIIRFQDDKAKVILFIDKQKASEFDGILGVLPDNDNPGKVLITGELKLKLLSAFGRGELISLQWQKLQARTQRLDIKFTYPFLFNTPFGVDASFNLYKRDTLFLNLKGKIGVLYQMRGGDHLKVFYDTRSTNVLAKSVLSQGSGTLRPDYVDSRINLYGIGASISRTDYRYNPKRGYVINGEMSAGTKSIDKDPTVAPERYEGLSARSFIANVTFKGAYFIPIAKRQAIKIGLNGGYLFGQDLFESEMFRIGGLKTLRGFDQESIYANLYSVGTVEYRFLIARNSFAFAFFDGAYYEFNGVNNSVVDRPLGFGLGINFETKIGIFSVTYALGKQFSNPIDFRTGKLHFGIVNRF